MRGRLVKRAKNSWTIVIDAPTEPNGKRRQVTRAIRGPKRLAEQKLAELFHQLDNGIPVETAKLTVGDYLETWLQDVVSVRNAPRTVSSYAVIVRNHINPVIGQIPLAKLQPGDVERLEARLLASGLSANTVHHVHVVLSKAFKDAMRKGILHRNVCQMIQPPSPGRYEVKLPDASAVKDILARAVGTPYEPVFRFMAYTGCRRGEAIALQWCNVDLDRGVASIVVTAQRITGRGIVFQTTKSAAGRRGIALDPTTVEYLRAHRGSQLLYQMELGKTYQDHSLVFPGPYGSALDPSVLTR